MPTKTPTLSRNLRIIGLDGEDDRAVTASGDSAVGPSFGPGESARLAFILEGKAGGVRVVEPDTGAVQATFPVGQVKSFAWDSSGEDLYALVAAGRKRARIVVCHLRTGTHEVGAELKDLARTCLAMSVEKETAWLSGSDAVSRITGLVKLKRFGADGPWSMTLRIPGEWASLAAHPVTGLVHGLVHREGAWQLLSEGKPRAPVDILFPSVGTPDPWAQTTAWSPDGSSLAFVHSGRLHLVDPEGRNARPVTEAGRAIDGPPVWHPSGTRIGFVSGAEIVLVDLVSGRSEVVRNAVANDGRIAFLPAGEAVAYSRALPA